MILEMVINEMDLQAKPVYNDKSMGASIVAA